MMYPRHYYITTGVGYDQRHLVAFDNALIDANISEYNLVKISSILPADCVQSLTIDLRKGSPLLTAYATISSSIIGETVSAAVAVGVPDSKTDVGIIMEFSHKGNAIEAELTVKSMVKRAMANHNIAIKEIISKSVEAACNKDGETVSLIAAISIW